LTSDNYLELVEIYNKHKEDGLMVFGFPCGQFMGQELDSEQEIKEFVENKFEVKFPMFSKIEVNGPNTHPIYRYLKANSQEMSDNKGLKNIPWNFGKFVVDSQGKVLNFYKPNITPKEILKVILPLLKK
jgi:glutathione peroxidase